MKNTRARRAIRAERAKMKIKEIENRHVSVSAHTITVKTEQGKTSGLVRNIDNMYDIQPSKKFQLAQRLKGLDRAIYMSHLHDILVCDNEMFVLCDDYVFETSKKIDSGNKCYWKFIEVMEGYEPVTVIHCARVHKSRR